jgi:hypothetical protein
MLSQRKTLIAAACGTAALLAAIPAMAGGGGWGGWHGRGGPGGLIIIETFDLNKDGKITQAEIDQARKDQLAKYDTNKDGVLNLEEYQVLWMDAMRRMMVRQFQANDADGDGRITVEEFTARFADLVRDRDRNGDGVLTVDELRPHGRGPHRGPGPGDGPGPGPGDDGE